MIPLFKPYMPRELPELEAILHSNNLSYDKWGKIFEEKLGQFIGNHNIVVVNSYYSAILVVLTTLKIRAGDEVIASPMSCLATNQPFAVLGIRIIWADIDPLTGTLSPESVKQKISAKTKIIFHNHYCGYPGFIDEINEIGRQYGLYIVDDSIEAFGSEYKGNKIGNTGSDVALFSFQTIRLPNTIDGGAISFKDKTLFEKAKQIRDLGIDRTLFRDEIGEISSKCDIQELGYGATLSEPNNYIGSLQMDKIKELLELQRKNAQIWKDVISNDYPHVAILGKALQNPNYWVFGILATDKKNLMLQLRNKGFYASGVHYPNNNYSVFGKQSTLPGVDKFYSNFIALPCGWWLKI